MAKNEMMVLTSAGVNALTNKELKSALKNVLSAMASERKSTWQIATEYAKIVTDELFAEDFETENEFAKYVGVSKATLSQYKNAVAFMTREGVSPADYTVGKAYMMSTLTEEEYIEFITMCAEEDIDISSLSDKALKDMIKNFKEVIPADAEVEEETEEQEEAEEQEDTAEEQEDVSRETIIENIKSLMREWNIIIEELM